MQKGSVDVVVTSPPYNLGIKYSKYDDNIPRQEYLNWLCAWASDISEVLSDGGSLFLNMPHRTFVWVDTIYGIEVLFLAIGFLQLNLTKPEADGEPHEYLGGGLLPLYRLTSVMKGTFGVLWKRPHFSHISLGSHAPGLSRRLFSAKRSSVWISMLNIRRGLLSPVPNVRGCVPYMTT